MPSLFTILNPHYDLIYEYPFKITEKQYCTMFLLTYASIDLFNELKFIKKNCFYAIEKQFGHNVSVRLINNGFVLVYVGIEDEDMVEMLFDGCYEIVKNKILEPRFLYKEMVKDELFSQKIESVFTDVLSEK